MQKYRSYVLPVAIILGLLFHRQCEGLKFLTPYIIFTILLLNFTAVEISRLRYTKLDTMLMLFQITVSLGSYLLLSLAGVNEIIKQGILIGVICPVAASSVVISSMLGANRETTTTYTMVGNLMVAAVCPIYFSFIGTNQTIPFMQSFLLIFSHIAPAIGLPFLIAILMHHFMPGTKLFLSKYSGMSFYLWAFVLFITLGQTFSYMFQHGKGNVVSIIWLAILSAIFCAIQFGTGKYLGWKSGDTIAGGQLLGQKNTAIGIWMANTYLHPLASLFLAFYSVWQNTFNSLQLWRHDRRRKSGA